MPDEFILEARKARIPITQHQSDGNWDNYFLLHIVDNGIKKVRVLETIKDDWSTYEWIDKIDCPQDYIDTYTKHIQRMQKHPVSRNRTMANKAHKIIN